MQSANLDIYAVRARYIIDGAIRYTLYIYDTDCIRLKLYLGEVDICISSWPLEPEEKKNHGETCLKAKNNKYM